MKSSFKNILIFVLLIVTVIVFAMILSDMRKDKEQVTYSDILSYFDEKRVYSAEYDTDSYLTLYLRKRVDADKNGEWDLDENEIPLTEVDGKGNPVYQKVVYRLASYVQLEKINELCEDGLANGWISSYDFEEPTDTPWYISFLPYIIVIVLFLSITRQSRSAVSFLVFMFFLL